MKAALIAVAALALSPALAQAAGPSGTAVPAKSKSASAAQSPMKCADGTKSKSRTNPCVGHGGVDKATLAAVTEHASGGSNAASKGVVTTSNPPAKTANR